MLADYVADVRNKKDHDFSAPQDWKRLAGSYLNPLSRIYRRRYGYSTMIPLPWAIVVGLICDGILYLLESLFRVQYVLFFTLGMLLY